MRQRQSANGIAASSNADLARFNQVLFQLLGANFQSTADQIFTKVFSGTEFSIADVRAIRRTGGATVACLGGVYTGPNKSGSSMVSAAQSWLGLTGALGTVLAGIALQSSTSSTLYLSLTTGSIGACTADVIVSGVVLS